MSSYRVDQQGLIKSLARQIDSKINFSRFPTEVRQNGNGWSWYVADDKKYTGSLWFRECEPGPDRDYCFIASVGVHDVRLLADRATVVVRDTRTNEVEKTFRFSWNNENEMSTELGNYFDDLLWHAFWKRGNKVGAPRPPKGRSPHLRRTRRAARRQLIALRRKEQSRHQRRIRRMERHQLG